MIDLFKELDGYKIKGTAHHDSEEYFTLEDLYQSFKYRMIEESKYDDSVLNSWRAGTNENDK